MSAAEQEIREVLGEIAADMKRDAEAFDGKPFTGRTVAEYLGHHGAAIAALAATVARVLDVLDDRVGTAVRQHAESDPHLYPDGSRS